MKPMLSTLKNRIDSYSAAYNHKILAKLPIITIVNGRSFAKLTTLINKPFSNDLAQCFSAALGALMQEMDGTIFGYSHNDELVIVSRNDQTPETQPWYNNDIQKSASISASIATVQFNNYAASLDLDLIGEPVFYSQVFAVPNITEAINLLVCKQQQSFFISVQLACFFELSKKFEKNNVKNMLSGATIDEKIDLLKRECGINYNEYPAAFIRGIGCYRTPKIMNIDGIEQIKNKLTIDVELPIFTREHDFLGNIFRSGKDIFRAERDV
jgi:tRNA(His) guanylyltransferase